MDNNYYREYYYRNINNFKQYTKKYYDLKKLDNEFNAKRTLYLKNYYEKNRHYLKDYMKVYYYENKKSILEKQKKYRIKNSDKIKEYHKKRYLNKINNSSNIPIKIENKSIILTFD